jgi:hypothetical protein
MQLAKSLFRIHAIFFIVEFIIFLLYKILTFYPDSISKETADGANRFAIVESVNSFLTVLIPTVFLIGFISVGSYFVAKVIGKTSPDSTKNFWSSVVLIIIQIVMFAIVRMY